MRNVLRILRVWISVVILYMSAGQEMMIEINADIIGINCVNKHRCPHDV